MQSDPSSGFILKTLRAPGGAGCRRLHCIDTRMVGYRGRVLDGLGYLRGVEGGEPFLQAMKVIRRRDSPSAASRGALLLKSSSLRLWANLEKTSAAATDGECGMTAALNDLCAGHVSEGTAE